MHEVEDSPLVFGWQNSITSDICESTEVTPTLDKSKIPAVMHEVEINQLNPDTPHIQDRIYGTDGVAPTCAKGNGGNTVAAILTEETAYSICANVIGRSDTHGGNQITGVKEEEAPTLTKNDIHAVAYSENVHTADTLTKCPNQTTGFHGEVVLYGFDSLSSNSMKSSNPHSGVHVDEVTKTLDTFHNCPSKNQGGNCVIHVTTKRVRRLTPTEFARLQGFPDDWANIKPEPESFINKGKKNFVTTDANQYAAYGNSMTTNVMRWLGRRIKAVSEILELAELEK